MLKIPRMVRTTNTSILKDLNVETLYFVPPNRKSYKILSIYHAIKSEQPSKKNGNRTDRREIEEQLCKR